MINYNPSPRLVKHIIRSYARLAENSRVRSILRDNLPNILKEKSFYQSLEESSRKWLQNLLKALTNVPANNGNNDRSMQIINGLNGNGINQGNYMMNSNEMTGQFNYPNYNDYMDNNKGAYLMNSSTGNGSAKNYLNLNGNVFTYKNGK